MNVRTTTAPVVLQIEDDAILAVSVEMLLRSGSVRSPVAASGDEALRLIARGMQPDVLLLDYHLAEDATGNDVAEEIALRLGHTVPTILLTGDLANVEIPWMPGAPMILVAKPVDPNDLLETIQHFTALLRSTRNRHVPSIHPVANKTTSANGV